jgi:hypothetical protein
MKTGTITITGIGEEGKKPTLEADFVDGTVWLSKNSIARLFGCYTQKVGMNLKSIFSSRLLREEDVTYTYRYTDGGIEKQILYYNLDVLIFLSYRIDTLQTQIFRDFVNAALREHLQKNKVEQNKPLIWVYQIGDNPKWN